MRTSSMKRTAEYNIAVRSGAPLNNSVGENPGGSGLELMRMFAQLLGGGGFRGPGDRDGGIALEMLTPRNHASLR